MSKRLLNLRDVPDDESEEVRALLDEHAIAFYETPPSRWGISMGGIWITRDGDYPRARSLLDDYQAERARRMRAEYIARRQRGEVDTLRTVWRRRPGQVLACVIGAAGVIGLMMWPVWLLINS